MADKIRILERVKIYKEGLEIKRSHNPPRSESRKGIFTIGDAPIRQGNLNKKHY